MELYNILLYFFIYGFLGWCIEVGFAACKQRKFVNRGFLNGPICPIYGFGITSVILLLEPLKENLLFFYCCSVILVTVLEGFTGWIMDKIFHNKWWDYSKRAFNIGGYVCLLFSCIWGLACVGIVYFIHPLIRAGVQLLPHFIGIMLLFIFIGSILADIIVTSCAIFQFNKSLEQLEIITKEMRLISNQIGEDISQYVLYALEIQEESKRKLNDMKLEVSEEIHTQINALRTRAKEIQRGIPKTGQRLIEAFPHMESRKHNLQLELLKKKLEQHFPKK